MDCSFDFIPIHWYGGSPAQFIAYLERFHALFPGYPIWITEFQFTNQSPSVTEGYVREVLGYLDSKDWIARYAMFGPMDSKNMAGIVGGAMVTDDLKALTTLGKIYTGQI